VALVSRGRRRLDDNGPPPFPPGAGRVWFGVNSTARLLCDMSASSDADTSEPRQPRVMGPRVGGAPLGVCRASTFWHSSILKAIHGVTALAIWLVVSWMPLARRAAVR